MTPLVYVTLAWMIGIVLAQWFDPPAMVIGLAALPALGGLWLYRAQPRARLAAVMGLVLVAGAYRLLLAQPVLDEDHIAFYNDTPHPIRLTGVVAAEPDVRDYYINLQLRVESLQIEGETEAIGGLVLVRAPRYPVYAYGDRLSVTGLLETPPIFEDFSYKDYLARSGIHSLIRRSYIQLIESGQGHPFWAAMLALKGRAAHTINRILAEPYASLLNGILLGIRSGIPRALYENFNLTGTSHVIVISGSNISLVAGIFLFLGQRLIGRRFTPPLAIAGVILYTFLVGADAAVSRAAIMGIVMILSLWIGRPGLALNSLFFSGLCLTALNPLILWDVGFQLSFVATGGLIVLVPPLEETVFRLLQNRLQIAQAGLLMGLLNEMLILTLAAQISVGPLLVYHFGRLSLISLFANMLIVPVQPLIMIAGGLAALAGMLWLPLGQALGWLVWLPLAWTVGVVEWMARLPYGSLDLGRFPLWLTLLVYAALAAGIWWAIQATDAPGWRRNWRPLSLASTMWLGGAGLAALLIWLAVLSLPDGRLHVTFLDVGQGDAILITTPAGRQILVDGGPSGVQLNWQLGRAMPFWDRSLDVVINTHPDKDHLEGLVSVPDRYRIGQLLMSDVAVENDLYRAWQTELAENRLQPVIGQANTRLDLGGGVIATLLNPGPDSRGQTEPNNRSIVLHIQYGQISFLLPGDIEAAVERHILEAYPDLKTTVLQAPHHGSGHSSSPAFLDGLAPRLVVISVGKDNLYGHPAASVLERYTERGLTILRTDQHGAIDLSTDGRRLWVETGR